MNDKVEMIKAWLEYHSLELNDLAVIAEFNRQGVWNLVEEIDEVEVLDAIIEECEADRARVIADGGKPTW